MPLGKDEISFLVEFFTTEDPSQSIRLKANDLIASHSWSTEDITYADQKEPFDEEQWYSCVFLLGLDHVSKDNDSWLENIKALLEFSCPLANFEGPESRAEIRFRSELWHSEHVGFLENMPSTDAIEHMVLSIIKAHTDKHHKKWWQFWK